MTIASLCLPFVDLHVNITKDELHELGFEVGDDQMIHYELLSTLVEHYKDQGTMIPGGAGANSLATISALGGKTVYFGKVAGDATGDAFTGDLRARGIQYNPLVHHPEGTPTCLIFITPDGERTMLFNPGLGETLGIHDVQVNEGFLEKAKILLTGLAYPMKDFKHTIDYARGKAPNAKLALTLQTYAQGQPEVGYFIREADIVIGSEKEFENLCHDLRAKSVAELTDRQPNIIFARTMGPQGAEIYLGGYQETVPVFPVEKIVDTTGAGDAWAGGFLYGLAYGRSLYDSALLGSYCAAQILEHTAGRLPFSTQLNSNLSDIKDAYPKLTL